VRDFAVWLAVLLIAPAALPAKRLPIRTYTTADGLARDHIHCIRQDSHGFLWFCTEEGLSRFDGYQFTTYRTEQGLPSNSVTDFLETRGGLYWIATAGGVCRFDPSGAPAARFGCFPVSGEHGVPFPFVLAEDREGGIWCGTRTARDGLFHLGPKDAWFRQVDLRMSYASVIALLFDSHGSLWVGSPGGLYRRDPDGSTRTYTTADGMPNDNIMALLEDREGQLWVGTRGGLIRMDTGHPSRMRAYSVQDGLPGFRIESLLQTSDGVLWVGTNEGLAERSPAERRDGREFQSYTLEQGLSAKSVGALAEDRDGNLWAGTFGSGAMKMARSGFTTYTDADGAPSVAALMETRQGALCVVSRLPDGLRFARFDGRVFLPSRPAWPGGIADFGWGKGQIAAQDTAGDWWMATGRGLYRFPPAPRIEDLAGARPKAVYTRRDGLPGNDIFHVFADSAGGVWIGTIGLHGQDGLARFDRATATLRVFSDADGLHLAVPTWFAEDRAGDVWVTFYHGGMARYRHGRFTVFGAADGVTGFVNSMFVDSTGRLWTGTSLGLLRVDDPTAEQPRFRKYATAQGLSSELIAAITEDRWGRMYAATGRGIDRFEPQPDGLGLIKHYTTADGIAPGELELAFRDRQGTLWFTTSLGLSQFQPAPDRPRVPPPVLVTSLSSGGIPYPISDLGQTLVSGLRLPRRPLRIDFVGLGFSPGEALRYQYMLEGADRDWGALTDQRSVIFANLAPGGYRFVVRAVASDGAVSPQPAAVAFAVLPPLWRTWWFLAACASLAILTAYAAYRYRLGQLLAVANLRTRIATDLHDDIGASLSQIAVLSEVAQRASDGEESKSRPPLEEIAGISRELLDSMSDIVWAIAPDHDRLSNLVYRMRRFATDVLGGQNISLQFRSAVAEHDLKVGADVRRQVYLIFKEGIHNIARHSGAARVDVDLRRAGNHLILSLRDDGKGFDPSAAYEGHGLVNMRRRARELGGTVEWQSAAGQGTTLCMTVRLEPARTLAALRGK
jgi:ligand-binding sensor domain-containing protein